MTDSTWSALNKLRWIERTREVATVLGAGNLPMAAETYKVLQQAWIHHGTWEEEWRDVPTVKEGEDR